MPIRRFAVPTLLVAATALGQEPLQRFENRNGTFHIGLPAGWRQVAPNEARRIGENPLAPEPLRLAQPHSFYAIGPVDRWLAGDFGSAWVYVVEQQNEWYVDDDFQAELGAMWAERGQATGERHELTGIRKEQVGEQQVDVVVATRTTTPKGGRPPFRCLDVHSPAGSSQLTLSFACAPDRFAAMEPEFRRWLSTLTFARVRKGQTSLGDRLWTPLLTGGAVGLILLLVWRHTRSRR